MAKPILVVGSINLDLVATAARVPAPGETISGDGFATFFGGKGANQAVAIGRLGYPVRMLGKVGDDSFGPQLRQALADAGVDVSAVETAAGPSGVALISTSHRGENSIIVVSGANGEITIEDLDRHRGLVATAGIVLAQLEIPLPVIDHLSVIAKETGVPLMLDPAPARPLSAALLQRVDWITPNESETRSLLGLDNAPLESESASRAAQALLQRGPRNVLLKLGGNGVFLAQSDGTRTWIPAFKVKAIDTTAAGDAFNGAFAVGLVSGKSAIDSARYACAVAAISVTRRGAQPSMPNAAEVRAFLIDRAVGTSH